MSINEETDVSENNGVVRIGRKGVKKFAFGEHGAPFEVDVVVAFQGWLCIDDEFREREGCVDRGIKTSDMPEYHRAAVGYVSSLAGGPQFVSDKSIECEELSAAEALEFIAKLRDEYDGLVAFFRPKSRKEQDSPATSEGGLQFSEEAS